MTPNKPSESYTIADPETQHVLVSTRRADKWVGFFLPHLRPEFSVLDCGCGAGSITLDIAEKVASGTVVGIDTDEIQLAAARENAKRRGLANVFFEQESIYDLRFTPASFDAALAHTLLLHLSDPLRALKEIRRMLKPGGVAAISDDDCQTIVHSPDDPLMREGVALWIKMLQHNGGSPFYSRHLRSLLLQAGFSRTEGHTVAADCYGTLKETRRFASIVTGLYTNPGLVKLAISKGWATQEEMEGFAKSIHEWGERPDAFYAVMYCAALGWKG